MILRILASALLALYASNAVADDLYIYKHKGEVLILKEAKPSRFNDRFTDNVKVTYYSDSKSTTKKVDKKQTITPSTKTQPIEYLHIYTKDD